MPEVQDQTQGCTSVKRPARKTVKRSPKHKKSRARVDIGLALGRWHAVKTANGLKSHADVARYLLDVMKRSHCPSEAARGSDPKITLSRSELQTLIRQEVRSAVTDSETRLHGLIENAQRLDAGVNYEASIQKLLVHINTVSERAEAALAYVAKTQKKNSLPSCANVDSSRPEDEATSTTPYVHKMSVECAAKSGELLQIMETTKKALNKMRADSRAVTAALANLTDEPSPPVLAAGGPPEHKQGLARLIKEEPQDQQVNSHEEPKVKIGKERVFPGNSRSLNRAVKEEEQDLLSIPPLPLTTVPSTLSVEAAAYGIPPKLEVRLALVRNPPCLCVLWKLAEERPLPPPMESYTIFLTMEEVKGSGVFLEWKSFSKNATPLPMHMRIRSYKPGHKVCAAVVGTDVFGRAGPYSKVATATVPE